MSRKNATPIVHLDRRGTVTLLTMILIVSMGAFFSGLAISSFLIEGFPSPVSNPGWIPIYGFGVFMIAVSMILPTLLWSWQMAWMIEEKIQIKVAQEEADA